MNNQVIKLAMDVSVTFDDRFIAYNCDRFSQHYMVVIITNFAGLISQGLGQGIPST